MGSKSPALSKLCQFSPLPELRQRSLVGSQAAMKRGSRSHTGSEMLETLEKTTDVETMKETMTDARTTEGQGMMTEIEGTPKMTDGIEEITKKTNVIDEMIEMIEKKEGKIEATRNRRLHLISMISRQRRPSLEHPPLRANRRKRSVLVAEA